MLRRERSHVARVPKSMGGPASVEITWPAMIAPYDICSCALPSCPTRIDPVSAARQGSANFAHVHINHGEVCKQAAWEVSQ